MPSRGKLLWRLSRGIASVGSRSACSPGQSGAIVLAVGSFKRSCSCSFPLYSEFAIQSSLKLLNWTCRGAFASRCLGDKKVSSKPLGLGASCFASGVVSIAAAAAAAAQRQAIAVDISQPALPASRRQLLGQFVVALGKMSAMGVIRSVDPAGSLEAAS